jgi:nitrite reductase/ring-hydroxylating ferredoxin subunit
MAQEFTKVAQTDEVPPGSMKVVALGIDRVLLTNVDGEIHAVGEECTHAGGMLSEGYLEGAKVECPLHGAIFDVKTGVVEGPPADENLPQYSIKVEGDDILIAPA